MASHRQTWSGKPCLTYRRDSETDLMLSDKVVFILSKTMYGKDQSGRFVPATDLCIWYGIQFYSTLHDL